MRQLKFLFVLWLLPLIASSNHIHWLGDYDTALQKAHREGKHLLVLVVKKNSSLCNSILKKQFMNHNYIDSINKKMIAVIVMYEGYLSYPVEMYYTTVFPTLFLVDASKELFLKPPLYGKEIHKNNLKEYFLLPPF